MARTTVLKLPTKIPPGQSNLLYRQDESRNFRRLSSIKDVGLKDAEALYGLSDGFYLTFVDLLYDLCNVKGALNVTVIQVLIMSDYFSEFGTAGKLLDLFKEFQKGKYRITKTLKP